uniref:Uncharacterized protein n=2 Tax=Candidatus Kentrum sp. MB TaxID=2138164 RepID=A0A451BFE3_9GAMM|nr:MAG: hypothetical protein BECKMB1821H_GA0114242_108820 [Candidatus Kentron sp. MB]
MTLLRECVRLHFKLYLMPLPSPRSGFVQHFFKAEREINKLPPNKTRQPTLVLRAAESLNFDYCSLKEKWDGNRSNAAKTH